ncbi:hypothetical protein GS504_01925 [Rhodococcus hoagii]|nr:hypothetical protein [Prescottella equi]NKS56371.1 hypothetical protein [Prescottella equi]NKS72218.1 hypothetical protein [Prescottella equi]
MSDIQYVEMGIRVRARVRVPDGQTPEVVACMPEAWACDVEKVLRGSLLGGDATRYFDKVRCDLDVITDSNEWELADEVALAETADMQDAEEELDFEARLTKIAYDLHEVNLLPADQVARMSPPDALREVLSVERAAAAFENANGSASG